MSDTPKTLDDILYEGLREEVKLEMEKEAAEAVSTPAPAETSDEYKNFQKLAQLLRDVANDTPPTIVEDFKDTIKSVEEE